ncbi:LOW QUALITY PROTEIN: uncharacterized protein LOC143212399 [Lasioglossum baleicum]|uniref:LOW QUALITY PROTEIN: uncharacterized protein LOC143212399 n=1 Tax=Lasioglossum baleicum TaxID=434251 RepID=UPI003FCCD1A1
MRCVPCRRSCKMTLRKERNIKLNIKKLKNKSRTLQSSNCNYKRREERLRSKISKLYNKIAYLKDECSRCNEKVMRKVIKELPQNQQLAVEACFAAAKSNNKKGIRYATEWIYECILLRIKSRKTYNHLRSRNILTLPSIQTLNRYMKNVKGCYGFQMSTFELLKKKTADMESNDVRGANTFNLHKSILLIYKNGLLLYDKAFQIPKYCFMGVLLVDEMKLSQTLYFNRMNLKVEGFVDLGQHTREDQKTKKGDHALVLMFQPFKGTWVQSLACFLSIGNTSATILHKIIMECIILTEKSGLKIDAVVSDGASWNRSMWNIFGVKEDCVSIQHVVDTERRLWFISDFPHLVKCLSNYFSQFDRYAGIWVSQMWSNLIIVHTIHTECLVLFRQY